MAVTLKYDFATAKTLAASVGPTLSITRATSATYYDGAGVLQTATTGVARFDHDPSDSTSLGLLVEEARTNTALYSDDLTNAAWVKTSTTAAKDATGLDAITNSASTLTASGASGTCFQTVTLGSAEYTYSVYIKRKTGTGTIEITDNGGTNYTDVTSLINSSTYTRFDITRTQANPVVGFRITTSGDEIEVDASQLEAGAFPTSYIATAGATATRNQDNVISSDVTWYNEPEGSLYIDAITVPVGNFHPIVSIDDGTSADQVYIQHNTVNDALQIFVRSASINRGNPQTAASSLTTGTRFKGAAAFTADDFVVSIDGATVVTDTSGTPMPTGLTTLRIGEKENGINTGQVWLAELRYYDERLTDAEVETLSLTGNLSSDWSTQSDTERSIQRNITRKITG